MRLYWEGAPGQRAGGWGTQEDGSVMWLAISGSMVKGWRACVAQPRWMPTRRICGGGGTQDTWPHGVSSQISSSWWWLVSAVFLTRPSCCKITHTNCYYGAWTGWAVLVSVFPLTILLLGIYPLIEKDECTPIKRAFCYSNRDVKTT